MRALWSGRLQFSHLDFPVKIYSATQSEEIHFNTLHAACGARIKHEKRCPVHGPVLEEEIVKAYEYDKGKYVTISEQELDALAPKSARALELMTFVEPPALDPLIFDTPYYLVPDGPIAAEAYGTLREAIRESGKYGIGKVIMRRKEYLIALWCKDNAILVSTLRYDHEVKGAELFDDLQGADKKNKEEIRKTAEIITHHTKKFRHKNYKDGYQDKLLALIKQKVEQIQAAERVQAPAEVSPLEAVPMATAANGNAQPPKRGMVKAPPVKKQRRKTGS